jgi:phage-related protein
LDGIGAPRCPGFSNGCPPASGIPAPEGPGWIDEIRLHTEVEHRILDVAKFEEAVYVLHAFEKRTRKTPATDIAVARERLGELRQVRPKRRKP